MLIALNSAHLILASAGYGRWYEDARTWVAVSVILFLGFVIWKGALKAAASALDARAAKISADLDEARRLREEAQALLASYHRKQKDAEAQAQSIVAQARRDAEAMAGDARRELAERLERRTAQAEEKIASAEAQAMNDVRARAADIAVKAAEQILRKDLKAADHSALVKSGLTQMGKMLN